MSGGLEGVTVLDLSRLLPGGYCTMLLNGLGARVIKVEDPRSPDGTRMLPPFASSGESGAHVVLNRGKESIAIDLKSEEGRQILLELVSRAQILVDSFRPGVMDRLGLGRQALEAANPTLVHITINAYGTGGPYESVPAHDLNALGFAGVLGLSQGANGEPGMPPIQIADVSAGLQGALAAVTGLLRAGRGEFAFADVSMMESAFNLLTLAAGTVTAAGSNPPVPDMLTGAASWYGVYQCADGNWLTVAALEPKFFARMVGLMGLSDLAAVQYDPSQQSTIRQALAGEFASRERSYWLDLLAAEDTCVGPVNGPAEAFADPNLQARGQVVDVSLSGGGTAPAPRAVPWGPRDEQRDAAPAPGVSEHREAVLAELGISAERVAVLVSRGVLG